MIEKCLETVQIESGKKELISNIAVVGGNSLLSNSTERLFKELVDMNMFGMSGKLKPLIGNNSIERQHSSWLGGSIMASMPTFEQIMMTKEEYDEHGAILIERKCFS